MSRAETMTMPCGACGGRFGGTDAYERHLDRQHDRCKSARKLRALGLVADADGVWHRRPIEPQPPLIDKRSIPRVARRTRGGRALSHAGREDAPKYQPALSEAQRPGGDAA